MRNHEDEEESEQEHPLEMSTFENPQHEHANSEYGSDDEDPIPGEDSGLQSLLATFEGRHRGQRSTKLSESEASRRESAWSFVMGILKETAPTLFATVVGMVFTGELLEHVSTSEALKKIDELFILIPMLNNLKGNIEMNLSARLSTAANTFQLDDGQTRRVLLTGNLSLIQVQTLVLSALAATSSMRFRGRIRATKWPQKGPGKTKSGFREFMAVLSIGMSAACMSAFVLGSFMCSVVVICRKFTLNPDNISPPLASCLGDLLTLTLFTFMAVTLTRPFIYPTPLVFVLPILLFALLIAAYFATLRNKLVKSMLKDGWSPLLGAMIISSGTGIVLDSFVTKWDDFGSFAIVISGLSGSVGSIYISRLSTSLHATSASLSAKQVAPRSSHQRQLSISSGAVDPTEPHRPLLTAITLSVVAFPVQLAFIAFVYFAGWMELPLLFVGFYLLFFCFSTAFSLVLAHFLTHFLWARKLDPDTYCMPIHSSLVDFSAQLMLAGCYQLVAALGGDVKAK